MRRFQLAAVAMGVVCATFAHAAEGDIAWLLSFGGAAGDVVEAGDVDGNGNLVSVGLFRGSADFDPGAGTAELTPLGGENAFVQKLNADGEFQWAFALQSDSSTGVRDVAVDRGGNAYVLGNFRGTTDFDPGSGLFELQAIGTTNRFIAKYDSDGAFAWVRRLDPEASVNGHALDVDRSGNVYVVGTYGSTGDFDLGPGIFELTSVDGPDMFVLKLDTNGGFVWARSIGGADSQEPEDVAVDRAGNVHAVGLFDGETDFDPGNGEFSLTPDQDNDAFVLKLNSDGTFAWARQFGDASVTDVLGVAVDRAGNVTYTGRYLGPADFDPGPGSAVSQSQGTSDAYVVKLSAEGDFLWARITGGPEFARGDAVTVDDVGNAFIVGTFRGMVDFDPSDAGEFEITASGGASNLYIQALDAAGDFQYALTATSQTFVNGVGVGLDNARNVYIAGEFNDDADFEPVVPGFEIQSVAGSADAFALKIEGEGNLADVNGDGVVNAVDVQIVINAALGLSVDPAHEPDINRDNTINAVDVQQGINGALGLL